MKTIIYKNYHFPFKLWDGFYLGLHKRLKEGKNYLITDNLLESKYKYGIRRMSTFINYNGRLFDLNILNDSYYYNPNYFSLTVLEEDFKNRTFVRLTNSNYSYMDCLEYNNDEFPYIAFYNFLKKIRYSTCFNLFKSYLIQNYFNQRIAFHDEDTKPLTYNKIENLIRQEIFRKRKFIILGDIYKLNKTIDRNIFFSCLTDKTDERGRIILESHSLGDKRFDVSEQTLFHESDLKGLILIEVKNPLLNEFVNSISLKSINSEFEGLSKYLDKKNNNLVNNLYRKIFPIRYNEDKWKR